MCTQRGQTPLCNPSVEQLLLTVAGRRMAIAPGAA